MKSAVKLQIIIIFCTVSDDFYLTGGRRFDPNEGQFRVTFQPILNGGDLCVINCDANIVSYYTGCALRWCEAVCFAGGWCQHIAKR